MNLACIHQFLKWLSMYNWKKNHICSKSMLNFVKIISEDSQYVEKIKVDSNQQFLSNCSPCVHECSKGMFGVQKQQMLSTDLW